MSDTERSRAALVAILPDNSSGQISAQDLRDLLASVLGGIAGLYVQDGAVAQVINIAPSKLTGFAANSPAGATVGATPDHTDDDIEVQVDGIYWVEGSFSLTGTASRTVQLRLALEGTEVPGVGGRGTFNASGGLMTIHFAFPVAASAAQKFTVRAEADVDATSITLVDGSLAIKRIG